jgi:hypothetical protein
MSYACYNHILTRTRFSARNKGRSLIKGRQAPLKLAEITFLCKRSVVMSLDKTKYLDSKNISSIDSKQCTLILMMER